MEFFLRPLGFMKFLQNHQAFNKMKLHLVRHKPTKWFSDNAYIHMSTMH